METVELLIKAWPIFVGFITLVVLLAKMDNRLSTVEEKIKTLFELFNKKMGR